MTEFFVFVYAMLAMFVVQAMRRNQREARPNPQMVTAMGWGLFSLSSTLAVLFGAMALAMAIGIKVPLGALDAPLF